MCAGDDPPVHETAGAPRQRVVRAGRRRAKLTPAPGSDPNGIDSAPRDDDRAAMPEQDGGPNDARMRSDVPPHY